MIVNRLMAHCGAIAIIRMAVHGSVFALCPMALGMTAKFQRNTCAEDSMESVFGLCVLCWNGWEIGRCSDIWVWGRWLTSRRRKDTHTYMKGWKLGVLVEKVFRIWTIASRHTDTHHCWRYFSNVQSNYSPLNFFGLSRVSCTEPLITWPE